METKRQKKFGRVTLEAFTLFVKQFSEPATKAKTEELLRNGTTLQELSASNNIHPRTLKRIYRVSHPRIEKAKSQHDCVLTAHGMMAFEWWLANADGAGFRLLPEPHHTAADISRAKSAIKRDRDVVGKIRVERLHEGGGDES